MKKFLCSTLISLLVITPGLSTSAFADTNYSINTIESLEETLEAVSYTHLDVYKRQSLYIKKNRLTAN